MWHVIQYRLLISCLSNVGSALLRSPLPDVRHAPRAEPPCDVVADLQRLNRVRNSVDRLSRMKEEQDAREQLRGAGLHSNYTIIGGSMNSFVF